MLNGDSKSFSPFFIRQVIIIRELALEDVVLCFEGFELLLGKGVIKLEVIEEVEEVQGHFMFGRLEAGFVICRCLEILAV